MDTIIVVAEYVSDEACEWRYLAKVVTPEPLLSETVETRTTPLARTLSPHERLRAAQAALYALDIVTMRSADAVPTHAEVAIVGGGITGLIMSSELTRAGSQPVHGLHRSNAALPCTSCV